MVEQKYHYKTSDLSHLLAVSAGWSWLACQHYATEQPGACSFWKICMYVCMQKKGTIVIIDPSFPTPYKKEQGRL